MQNVPVGWSCVHPNFFVEFLRRSCELTCFSGVFVFWRSYKWLCAFFHCGFGFDVFSSLLIFFQFFRRFFFIRGLSCLHWIWELRGHSSWWVVSFPFFSLFFFEYLLTILFTSLACLDFVGLESALLVSSFLLFFFLSLLYSRVR